MFIIETEGQRNMESHRKGDFTEATVITELTKREIAVSIPFGDNERYDLTVEGPDEFYRLQVKTGWLSEGCIQFHGKSSHTNASGNIYKVYEGDVDFFVVYCHELDQLYLVREDEFNTQMQLRIEEPELEQPTINWAEEYEFDQRWPPENDSKSRSADHRETVLKIVEENGIDYFDARSLDTPYDLLLRTPSESLIRTVLRFGSISGERLRFDTGNQKTPGPDAIDAVIVYWEENSQLFFVPRSEYESSFSIHVTKPERVQPAINYAENYSFDEQWPPDSSGATDQ